MTPEEREAHAQRVEAARRYEQNMWRCHATRCHAERGSALASEGLRQMAACSAPAEFTAAHTRWQTAQQASETRQVHALGMLGGPASGTARVLRPAEVERAEGLAEVTALAGATSAAEVAVDAERSGRGDGGDSVDALLGQLKAEPAAAEECAAKFKLYEGYATQVEKMRGSLFGFYEESLPTLPPAVAAEMKQVRAIDSEHAMGIHDRVREWFVYHMMRQAAQNNMTMASVLRDFEKKMELLASLAESDCPVCLEPFAQEGPHVAETLGCCHKVCHECWVHWTGVMRGSAFCPLCRKDAFLGAVADRAAHR